MIRELIPDDELIIGAVCNKKLNIHVNNNNLKIYIQKFNLVKNLHTNSTVKFQFIYLSTGLWFKLCPTHVYTISASKILIKQQ